MPGKPPLLRSPCHALMSLWLWLWVLLVDFPFLYLCLCGIRGGREKLLRERRGGGFACWAGGCLYWNGFGEMAFLMTLVGGGVVVDAVVVG